MTSTIHPWLGWLLLFTEPIHLAYLTAQYPGETFVDILQALPGSAVNMLDGITQLLRLRLPLLSHLSSWHSDVEYNIVTVHWGKNPLYMIEEDTPGILA